MKRSAYFRCQPTVREVLHFHEGNRSAKEKLNGGILHHKSICWTDGPSHPWFLNELAEASNMISISDNSSRWLGCHKANLLWFISTLFYTLGWKTANNLALYKEQWNIQNMNLLWLWCGCRYIIGWSDCTFFYLFQFLIWNFRAFFSVLWWYSAMSEHSSDVMSGKGRCLFCRTWSFSQVKSRY
jgi:hypothetical protein